ncbi:MAG: hypothetical protein ACJ76V_16950 [Thermoleophilaceae bacterium]
MAPRLLAALVACALALATAAGSASANPVQQSIIQDEARMLYSGQKVQDLTLDEAKTLGADIVKVTVNWSRVAPAGSKKPTGFVGSDPAEYPEASWAAYDNLVRGAAARGLKVFFLVGGRAPAWATQKGGTAQGSYKPDPVAFGNFVKALGTRYSGNYTPAGQQTPTPDTGGGSGGGGGGNGGTPACPPGQQWDPQLNQCVVPISLLSTASFTAHSAQASGALPKVTIWSVWNEPNLNGWLQPQWLNRNVPASPAVYRGLLLAAHDSLVQTGHAGDELLIGELLPFIRGKRDYPSRVSPLQFLRELACVDKNYKPYRGSAAAARGCSNYKPLPGTGIAHHPYTLKGPDVSDARPDDVAIMELGRMNAALKKLTRAHRFEHRSMPIWLTEFGYQTNPPDPYAFPSKLVPRYMGMSEWFAFKNRLVKSYAQYPLRDDPVDGRGPQRFHGFQSGIRSSAGRLKRGVYQAYEYPFFVRQANKSSVEIFGGVRVGKPGDKIVIQSKAPGGASYFGIPGGTLSLGTGGYFDKTLRIRNAGLRSFRFVLATDDTKTSVALAPFARPPASVILPPPGAKKKK